MMTPLTFGRFRGFWLVLGVGAVIFSAQSSDAQCTFSETWSNTPSGIVLQGPCGDCATGFQGDSATWLAEIYGGYAGNSPVQGSISVQSQQLDLSQSQGATGAVYIITGTPITPIPLVPLTTNTMLVFNGSGSVSPAGTNVGDAYFELIIRLRADPFSFPNGGGNLVYYFALVNAEPVGFNIVLQPGQQVRNICQDIEATFEPDFGGYSSYFGGTLANFVNEAENGSLCVAGMAFGISGDTAGSASIGDIQILNDEPVILQSPTNVTTIPSADVTFSVVATNVGLPDPLTYQWYFNGTSISGATGPSLTLTNVSSNQAGDYSVEVGPGPCSVTAYATLTMPSIILQRLDSLALQYEPSDGIDSPLTNITSDPSALVQEPELGQYGSPGEIGLVADGVTPLLLQFDNFSPGVNYQISLSVQGGSLKTGNLANNLSVLANSEWVATTNLTITSSAGFAYIAPITADDLILDPPNVKLTVTLTVSDGSTMVASTTFAIRKPPIVLVHGYSASSSTWGPAFTNLYALGQPSDFVIPIDYGVTVDSNGNVGTDTSLYPNTYGRLDELALDLNSVLQSAADLQTSILRYNWAFTRYDIVGHSQGGVLVRMLCCSNATAYFPAFRNAANFYRGRFDRIITIGSPHNGSLFLYYLEKVLTGQSGYAWVPWLAAGGAYPWEDLSLIQTKFDPFGPQIAEVNSFSVDSGAKFHLIRTTIASGAPPGIVSCPGIAYVVGLCHELSAGVTRGSVVLPNGFDGIVDYDSEGGGTGTPVTTLTGDISHAGPEGLFGVLDGSTETQSSEVAQEVESLLDGPVSNFGPFIMPNPVPASIKSNIDLVIPETMTIDAIQNSPIPLVPSPSPADTTNMSFNFNFAIPTNDAAEEGIDWFAHVFGTNGLSTNGVAVQVDTNNSQNVTVMVDSSVVGQVVLYASYVSTNGNIILSDPVLAYSNPAGAYLSGITLAPSQTTLAVGDSVNMEIWGEYTNNTSSLLYVSPDQPATFTSSNPSVVAVDTNGVITAEQNGFSLITVSYQGFSAQATIGVVPATGQPLLGSPAFLGNGAFGFNIVAQPNNGNYFYIFSSTNLVDWNYLNYVYSTSVITPFVDPSATNGDQEFYWLEQFQ